MTRASVTSTIARGVPVSSSTHEPVARVGVVVVLEHAVQAGRCRLVAGAGPPRRAGAAGPFRGSRARTPADRSADERLHALARERRAGSRSTWCSCQSVNASSPQSWRERSSLPATWRSSSEATASGLKYPWRRRVSGLSVSRANGSRSPRSQAAAGIEKPRFLPRTIWRGNERCDGLAQEHLLAQRRVLGAAEGRPRRTPRRPGRERHARLERSGPWTRGRSSPAGRPRGRCRGRRPAGAPAARRPRSRRSGRGRGRPGRTRAGGPSARRARRPRRSPSRRDGARAAAGAPPGRSASPCSRSSPVRSRLGSRSTSGCASAAAAGPQLGEQIGDVRVVAAAEELVASLARQRDLHVLCRELRDEVGRERGRVGERLVEGLRQRGQEQARRPVAGRALGAACRSARATRRASSSSSKERSSKPIEKVRTGSELSCAASAVSAEESIPPESSTPTGTSADEMRSHRVSQPRAQLLDQLGLVVVPELGQRPRVRAGAKRSIRVFPRSRTSTWPGGSLRDLAEDRQRRRDRVEGEEGLERVEVDLSAWQQPGAPRRTRARRSRRGSRAA